MRGLIAYTAPPISRDDLETLEAALPIPIPRELHELLAETDGGPLESGLVLRVPDGSTAGAIRVLRAVELGPVTEQALGGGSSWLAWAEDGSGNLLTIDAGSQVYFWDHDTDEHIPFRCQLHELHERFEVQERLGAPAAPTADGLSALLESGADADALKAFVAQALSATPEAAGAFLQVAVLSNRPDLVGWIGGDATDLGKALRLAASGGAVRIIEAVLANGGEIDMPNPHNEMTALMSAASAGQMEAVRLLLAYGADPRRRTQRNLTASKMAGISGHLELEKLLAEAEQA